MNNSTSTWSSSWGAVPQEPEQSLIEKLHYERLALSEKMEKLKLFISYNPNYHTLSDESKELLNEQLFYMHNYEEVLLKRMKLLNQPQITYTNGTTS